MRKVFFLVFSLIILISSNTVLSAASPDEGEKSAMTLRANALLKESAGESLRYLTTHIGLAKNDMERRSILYYTATLQEQMGHFTEAAVSYASAAGINEPDAKGMPKATNAQLYICAARASLGACDFESADSYLDASPVNSSKDQGIIAQKRLLGAWSALCKVSDYEDAQGVIANLQEFIEEEGMKDVKPSVLFTLWYVTGESKYGDSLKKEFPYSPETMIVEGKSEIMGLPFWYFMPRASLKDDAPSVYEQPPAVANTAENDAQESAPSESKKKDKVVEQVGFFRDRENAVDLVSRVKDKGFEAYYYTETRSSGTMYYIVVVDENRDGTVGKELRAAGFDCYPIKE